MTKVFVSGCYDIIHAGHVRFFEDARALGDHLTVCFASDDVLMLAKGRRSSLPEDNKMAILKSLRSVDHVVKSSNLDPVFDFADHVSEIKPDILAVTGDDKNIENKRAFCGEYGIKFVVLPKRNDVTRASTTAILASLKRLVEVPLRVDFGGGWLDVPMFARPGSYIVNCTIEPKVSLEKWDYETGAGLGGSAADAILRMRSGLSSELSMGVGWQDPAIIEETGLCVWRSGPHPVLEFKSNPDWLAGRMLLLWMGKKHVANEHVKTTRDYDLIVKAGRTAAEGVLAKDLSKLCAAVATSYQVQLGEGMEPLPDLPGAKAKKYLGAGHGGYALYVFASAKDRDHAALQPGTKPIEPCIVSKSVLA